MACDEFDDKPVEENHRVQVKYEAPYGRRVSNSPEGVVALIRYRGLQFTSLYLRQGESLPHVIGEGKE